MASENEDVVRWLKTPAAYPHCPDHVESIETHISHVFLAGPLVYKLKKPVQYGFCDLTTLAAREHACREEIRLNRRLAPDAYLKVVAIRRNAAGSLEWDGDGEVVDYVVVMRRLPTDLTLDALFKRGELLTSHIDRLTRTLVAFYRSLPPLPLTTQAYRQRYEAHIRENARELLADRHGLPPSAVKRATSFQLQLLNLQPHLLDERVRAGRIVDGHGDLRPEHICLGEPITIFDCIEFSSDFRTIDVADELAFLAAECDFLGATWVGPRLIAAYEQQTGDRVPEIVAAFYRSYRACVRAKVAALRANQLQGSGNEAATTDAQKHLALADAYAQAWLRPLVIVIGGLSGTGKSTLAAAIANIIGAQWLRTDVIRQQLFGTQARAAPLDAGVYGADARRSVYEEMFRRARALHQQRISVVLDGTFSTVDTLHQVQKLASDPQSVLLAVQCVCRPEVARQRIAARLASGHDASQAGPEVHDVQQTRWETWPATVNQVQIDTELPLASQPELPLASQLEQALAALKPLTV